MRLQNAYIMLLVFFLSARFLKKVNCPYYTISLQDKHDPFSVTIYITNFGPRIIRIVSVFTTAASGASESRL